MRMVVRAGRATSGTRVACFRNVGPRQWRPAGAPVGPLRPISAGALLSSGTAERDGRAFEEWLSDQPHPLPRGRHDRT
jgi:hypothetical protein